MSTRARAAVLWSTALFTALGAVGASAQSQLPSPAVTQNAEAPSFTIDGLLVSNENDYRYTICISFTNRGTLSVSAIRFVFGFVDAFGDTQAEVVGDRVGLFSPGVEIRGTTDWPTFSRAQRAQTDLGPNCWHNIQATFTTKVTRLTVSVARVLYVDGNRWVSPKPFSPIYSQVETQL